MKILGVYSACITFLIEFASDFENVRHNYITLYMKPSPTKSQNLQKYWKKLQIRNFKIKISPRKNIIFHPGFFFWQDMNLYVRLRMFLSYTFTRIPWIFPPVVKIYDKNVRNRTYRTISCQKKKPGWKILFFRGEILI